MRVAEAEITLGVLAARRGELEQAVDYGRRVLGRERRSLPSLPMASSELAHAVSTRFGQEPVAVGYLDELRSATLVSLSDGLQPPPGSLLGSPSEPLGTALLAVAVP